MKPEPGYQPPPNTYDQPFYYIFDGSMLTDGIDALNQALSLDPGIGDFILRRAVGWANLVNPAGGGAYLLKDWSKNPLAGGPIFVNPAGPPFDDGLYPREQFYPATGKIPFDLIQVFRSIPIGLAQIGFMGVRRKAGALQNIRPPYPYKLKPYSYQGTVSINALASQNQIATQMNIPVSDYDFELKELRISYPTLSGTVAGHAPILIAGYPNIYFTGSYQSGQDAFYGPFYSGGNIYVALLEDFSGGIVTMFMSADGGLTWTAQDTAGQPTTADDGFSITQAGTVLQLALVESHDIVVQTFDCVTNLWGAPSASLGIANAKGTAIRVQPSGNRFVFYTTSGVANDIEFAELSAGGVWTVPTVIDTAAALRVDGLLDVNVDTSGNFQVFFLTHDSVGGVNTVINQIPVSSVGVVGALTQIAGNFAAPSVQADAITAFNATLNQYAIPVNFVEGHAGQLPEVVIGNPVAGWKTISPDPLGLTLQTPNTGANVVQAFSVGSTFIVFWTTSDRTTFAVNQIWSAVWNGTSFSNPTLVYDLATLPPPDYTANPPFSPIPDLINVSINQRPDGSFDLLFSVETGFTGHADGEPAYFASFAIKANEVTTIQLFDAVRFATSNIPLVDSFLNRSGYYQNGAIVPALLYPISTAIRMIFYSQVTNPMLLPFVAQVEFVGVNRFPC